LNLTHNVITNADAQRKRLKAYATPSTSPSVTRGVSRLAYDSAGS